MNNLEMNELREKQELITKKVLEFSTTFKAPEGVLKHHYIFPGDPYSTQLWDWDSYWVVYATLKLAEKLQLKNLREDAGKYAMGLLLNFFDHQGKDGSIPILLDSGDADWFDSTKPPDNNMAKPFIGQFALLLWENGIFPLNELKEKFYHISFFHESYEKRYKYFKTGLFFGANDLGLGIDDDSCTWGRPNKSWASIFFNCFLYKDLLATATLAKAIRRPDIATEYRNKTDEFANSIRKYCYDKREKVYFSVDTQCRQNIYQHRYYRRFNAKLAPFGNCLQLKVLSWTSILPFWTGIGSNEEMTDFVKENMIPEHLLSKYGVRSLSKDEAMYAPEVACGNPSNWLGGLWTIANFISIKTLKAHGFDILAKEIIAGQIKILADDLKSNGYFHEYHSCRWRELCKLDCFGCFVLIILWKLL
jgi:putative isomerase